MTLLALIAALGMLVIAGSMLVGAGLWLADRCCPAGRRDAYPSLYRRKGAIGSDR